MSSARYYISALVASDLVPCIVRLGDFLYLPVTGSLPSEILMRHVFFLPVFSTDPMSDNELLPDIVFPFLSLRKENGVRDAPCQVPSAISFPPLAQ